MKNKIISVVLCLSLIFTVIPAVPAQSQTMSEVPDISDSTARSLVINAIESFQQKDAVGYILEGNGSLELTAYDSKNEVGVHGEWYPEEISDPDEITLSREDNYWYDLKNACEYFSSEYILYDFDSDEWEHSLFFTPMSEGEINNLRNYNFKEFADLKESGFIKADSYTYEGLEWRSANGVSHLCYKIGVPEEDPSLYDYDQYYLPKYIYIGVDDGEIYAIYEEYIIGDQMQTVIRRFYTDFFYPESLSVPENFQKAMLSPYTTYIYDDVAYYGRLSDEKKRKIVFDAGELALDSVFVDSNVTNLTVQSSVKIKGKKYPVEMVSEEAFAGEDTIKTAKLGNDIKLIQDEAFYGCAKLTSVKLPKKALSIGDEAFLGCKKLKSVTIYDKLVFLGRAAFKNCTSLKTVTLGAGLEDIERKTFTGCKALKTIKVKNKKLKKKLSSKAYRKKAGISEKVKIV